MKRLKPVVNLDLKGAGLRESRQSVWEGAVRDPVGGTS